MVSSTDSGEGDAPVRGAVLRLVGVVHRRRAPLRGAVPGVDDEGAEVRSERARAVPREPESVRSSVPGRSQG